MRVRFSKMHGAGNDFVVIDSVSEKVELSTEQIRFLCDRHLGVGADQLLMVLPAQEAGIDFQYRIFNQDGSEVEQCGNGARCFVRFVYDHGLTEKKKIRVQTMKTVIEPELLDDGRIRVNMGSPIFQWSSLPFVKDNLPERLLGHSRQWFVEGLWCSPVSMGNPTATVFVENVDTTEVQALGRKIQQSAAFPNQANVAFVEIEDSHHARIRVYERGAGETLACGSGTCAAMVAAMQAGYCDNEVEVQARGGNLKIQWTGRAEDPVFLIGPAVHVFDSEIDC